MVTEDRTVPGPEGAPDISVRIYRPVGATGALSGIVYIHGGGKHGARHRRRARPPASMR